MRKNLGTTKYLREKIRSHEKKIWTHGGTRPTGPTLARDPGNLAHSVPKQLVKVLAENSLVGDPLKKLVNLRNFMLVSIENFSQLN